MTPEQLPGLMEMRRLALQWAMGRRGGYLAADLREHLAALFKLTPDKDEDEFSKTVTAGAVAHQASSRSERGAPRSAPASNR
jgi:hypothetical protein